MIKYNPKEKKLSNFRYAIKRIKNPRKKNLSFRSILFSGFNKFFFEGRRERKISGSLPPSLYSVPKERNSLLGADLATVVAQISLSTKEENWKRKDEQRGRGSDRSCTTSAECGTNSRETLSRCTRALARP